ncbi:COG3014 family protein [Wenyingzhuangia sp. IMCC45467]
MKTLMSIIKYLTLSVLVISAVSCATYNQLSAKYQHEVLNGEFEVALNSVDNNRFLKKDRNELLYCLEKGKIAYLKGDYKLSNELFNKADLLIEDHKKNLKSEVLGFLTNPEKTTYRSEDFEKVAIHYYKALNYIFLSLYDEALVEAKRINLQLQKINDSYPAGKKNRYATDAFALNLQGLLYEATGNLNDAFISYRNAVELYQLNDGTYFGVSMPTQLKKDIITTAHLLGFKDEELKYSELFNLTYKENLSGNKGDLIVFWESGLVPYKSQTYFSFTTLPGNNNGFVTIANEDLGINFPVPTSNSANNGKFSDISVFNIAFPKYEDRIPYFTSGKVVLNNNLSEVYPLELVEDYKTIAFQTLRDRTVREIGKIAIRVAAKKFSENIVRNQNENLGAVLGLINALTEKTDTRNWQTLPSKIYYTRLPLNQTENKVKVQVATNNGESIEKEFEIKSTGNLKFLNYITPQSDRTN